MAVTKRTGMNVVRRGARSRAAARPAIARPAPSLASPPGRRPTRVAAETPWRILPVTPARWRDLVTLFGPRGACAGCWCMFMRLPLAEFQRGKGAGNRRALRALVARRPPGLIAYHAREPVGWVAVAPREEFRRLENSRVLAPVRGEQVWAAPCFFVHARFRGAGLSQALLEAAAAWAERRGAGALEGYPSVNTGRPQPASFVWTGFDTAFRRAGFRLIARRSPNRPIMRRTFRAKGRFRPAAILGEGPATRPGRSPRRG